MAILGSTLTLQTLTKNQAFKDAPKKRKEYQMVSHITINSKILILKSVV